MAFRKLKSSGTGLKAIKSDAVIPNEPISFIIGGYEQATVSLIKNNNALLLEARNLSKIASWRFDIEARALTFSNEFFHDRGIHRDYLSNFKAYLDLICFNERDLLPIAIRQILKTGMPYSIAYHLNHRDGIKTILQHGYCEKDRNGKVVALLGTLEDVSENKTAGEQLRLLEEQYRLLLLSVHSNQAANKENSDISISTEATTSDNQNNHTATGKIIMPLPGGKQPILSIVLPPVTSNHHGRKAVLVEKVKAIIIELINGSGDQLEINFSQYLSEQLNYDYKYISSLFSEYNGNNIQHFFASQKIEAAKKLILLDELTLTEIAWKLHYSSVGHLSNQFKKITGLSPSRYKFMDRQSIQKIVQ